MNVTTKRELNADEVFEVANELESTYYITESEPGDPLNYDLIILYDGGDTDEPTHDIHHERH